MGPPGTPADYADGGCRRPDGRQVRGERGRVLLRRRRRRSVRKGVQLGPVLRHGGRSKGARPGAPAVECHHPFLRRRYRQQGAPPLLSTDSQRVLQPGFTGSERVAPPGRGQHGLLPFRPGRPHDLGERSPFQTVRGDVHGRGSRGPQLRSQTQDLPKPNADQRRPHAPRQCRQCDHVASGGNTEHRGVKPLLRRAGNPVPGGRGPGA